MQEIKSSPNILIVVDVVAGVAVDAYCFSTLKDARVCLNNVRNQRDLNDDDVQVFSRALDDYDV